MDSKSLVPTEKSRILGQGSFGQVVICPGGACKSFRFDEAFFHESALSIYLTGLPGIVDVKQVNCPNKMIVMDRYQQSLSDWIRLNSYSSGDKRVGPKLRLILDILIGLNSLHQLGLVHGDLKPANILIKGEPETDQKDKLTRNLVAVLADFGNTGSPLYIDLRFMTPFYAPADRIMTLSADIYSLGIMILEMWRPFKSYNRVLDPLQLEILIWDTRMPIVLKQIVTNAVNKKPNLRPTPADIYHSLTNVKLSCHLPDLDDKNSKYPIDKNLLCSTHARMRKIARRYKIRSPERTLGLLNYWISIRRVNPQEYLEYGMAILYLYNQIGTPSHSYDLRSYFGSNPEQQRMGIDKICKLLEEKRGLQLLILGY